MLGDGPISVRFDMACVADSSLEPPRALPGDKVLFPSRTLASLHESFGRRALPSPMMFEIKNMTARRLSHVGVLEFTAPQDGTAVLPAWMLNNLKLESGGRATFTLRYLSKLTYVKFQPMSYRFARDIVDPAKALTAAMQTFTCLTVGDCITARVPGGTQSTYRFRVRKVRPSGRGKGGLPAAGCIVDTDLKVEFRKPVEQAPELSAQVVRLGESLKGSVACGRFAFYRVWLEPTAAGDGAPPRGLKMELKLGAGDADVYVDTRENPTLERYQWRAVRRGSQVLEIPASDAKFVSKGWYFVGVYGYESKEVPAKKDAPSITFTLLADRSKPEESKVARAAGRVLGGGGTAGGDATAKAGESVCPTCRKIISVSAFALHTARCARLNFWCGVCGKAVRVADRATHAHCPVCAVVMPPADIAKHIAVEHKMADAFACRNSGCSATFASAAARDKHQKSHCPLRVAVCRWCGLRAAWRDLTDHETSCGGRSVVCSMCGQTMPRSKIDIHMAVEHRVNPSILAEPPESPPL